MSVTRRLRLVTVQPRPPRAGRRGDAGHDAGGGGHALAVLCLKITGRAARGSLRRTKTTLGPDLTTHDFLLGRQQPWPPDTPAPGVMHTETAETVLGTSLIHWWAPEGGRAAWVKVLVAADQ